MNTKTKIALAAVALLGVGYIGAAAWLGQRVQSGYEAQQDKLAGMFSAYGKLTERQYERGLFSAQSRYVLELPGNLFAMPEEGAGEDEAADAESGEGEPAAEAASAPEAAAAAQTPPAAAAPVAPVRLHIVDDIRHGPLAGGKLAAAVIHSRLERVEGASDELRQMFAKVPTPDIRATVHLSGATSIQTSMAAGEIRFDPNVALSWQGLEQTQEISADALHHKTRGTLPQVQVTVGGDDQAKPQLLRMQADKMQYDLDAQYDGQQWLMSAGPSDVQIEKLSLQVPGGNGEGGAAPRELLVLDKLRMQTRSTREGDFYQVHSESTATGALDGTPLQNVRGEVRLDRISAQAMADMQKLWASMPAAGAEPSPEMMQQQLAVFERMLADKAGYGFKLEMTAEGQAAQLSYNVSGSDGEAGDNPLAALTPGLPEEAQAGMKLLSRLKFDAAARLPKAWLPLIERMVQNPGFTQEQMQTQLHGLAQQGMLQEDEHAFSAQVAFEKGAVSVNGKSLFGGQ